MYYWVSASKCKFTASGAMPAGFDLREKHLLTLYYRHFWKARANFRFDMSQYGEESLTQQVHLNITV